MLENSTVTLSLSDFDELREVEERYGELATSLSYCFKYKNERNHNPEPPKCMNCNIAMGCNNCEIYKTNPPYTETLTVDILQLVRVAKEYALYGYDIDTDISTIEVISENGELFE